MTITRGAGLRHVLSLRLMVPLLSIVAVTGATGVYMAQRHTDRVFDHWLLDSAEALAHQIVFVGPVARLDLPPAAEAMLAYDEIDKTWFSVIQQGRVVGGAAGLPTQGSREADYGAARAFDASFGGQPVRVAAVEVGPGGSVGAGEQARATVLVAETENKRERARVDLLEMFVPLVALLVAAAISISFVLLRTIRPLERIAANWNERSHASLQAIGTEGVPRELMPFATALNELLARIRALLARERQFAATAAHQLRTSMTGLRLGAERAARAEDMATARPVLGELAEATRRLSRLLQQLLSLGRIDPEMRGDLAFVPTDLAALCHDVGSAFVDAALSKSIDLELTAPDVPIVVRMHPDLFGEAFANVLDNAVRNTPAGGRITIEFSSSPPAVHVSDSGPGVPPDERERVFERFVRGSDAVGEGSGLGLAIVREIAVLHGASATLSDSAAGGARITILFAPQ